MKFFHLSDLHIGLKLMNRDLREEQMDILRQVTDLAREEQPDAVVIAGDIYDKAVPAAEAVEVFDSFITELKRAVPEAEMMLISGNHDSPERLAFGNRLLDASGIHISPVYDGQIHPVILQDEHGPVHFWLLPFIKPAHVNRFLPDEPIESYSDACRAAIAQMNVDFSARNVLVTHQFVTGANTCESEELSVGGADNVDASVFEGFDYVALGHIHGPQNIGSNRIRYCGTPLKYSFSEASHNKSVTVVLLGAKGDLELQLCPLYPKHDMREIRGSFASVTDREFYTGTAADDYLHIILTDEEDVPEAVGKLRLIYPNLMKLSYDNTRTRADHVIDAAADVQQKTPLELFEELYELQNNQPMSEEQRDFAQNLIERIREEHA